MKMQAGRKFRKENYSGDNYPKIIQNMPHK